METKFSLSQVIKKNFFSGLKQRKLEKEKRKMNGIDLGKFGKFSNYFLITYYLILY